MESIIYSPSEIKKGKQKTTYKKIHPGRIRMFGKIIKQGQIVVAYPDEITFNINRHFVVLDDEGNVVVETKQKEVKKDFVIVPRTGMAYTKVETSKGWFDVINIGTGKPLNEKKLRKDQADALVHTLNA